MSTPATSSPPVADPEPSQNGGAGRWIKRILLALLIGFALLVALVIGALLYFSIPSNAAGMAAKSICSASFVAGRGTDAEQLMTADVLPASPVLGVISTEIDADQHSVTAKFLGMFARQASLTTDRGCVLDLPPDPSAVPYTPERRNPQPWPAGDAVDPGSADVAELNTVIDEAFEGSGDPLAKNARGVAVVQNGKLLAIRDGVGFAPNTALHGWSMTKTVAGMLAWQKLQEIGMDPQTPVVQAFPAGREPDWLAQWRGDERAGITIADLFFMRDGLALDESYDPTGSVVQMLYGEPNMASWAAGHPADHAPGTYWEYLSATSNILAQVIQAQYPDEQSYWTAPATQLFDRLGVTTATMETDTTGTWVGSSYLWASVGDWARLGQLLLDDGRWNGERVLPAGYLKFATESAMPDGEGAGYGAQVWLPGNRVGGECKDVAGFPEDVVSMEGHWGQLVAAVPSRNAVIVRLGWTFKSGQFDGCEFVRDVIAALPQQR